MMRNDRGRLSMGRGAHDKDSGGSRKGGGLSKLLLVTGILLCVVACAILGGKMHDYWAGDRLYDDVSDRVRLDDRFELDADWVSLREENPDLVAWVQIPDTNIDYPVVQGSDNEYYLYHAFDGSSLAVGCPFLDYENQRDLSDNNNFIYGHNMRNGSMFHDLASFTDQGFFDEHPYAYIATERDGTRRYRIVGVFLAGGDEKVKQVQFMDRDDYGAYVRGLFDRCEVTVPDIAPGDITRTVILSTCSYQFNDARTMLICVEVDESGLPVVYPMSAHSLTPRTVVAGDPPAGQ